MVKAFVAKGNKRVVCTLNDILEMQCAIMPAGDDVWFINVNKKIRDQLKLKEGSKVHVSLIEDDSEFGMPFPEELQEWMEQDPEGKKLFFNLPPGRQRNIIYIVNQVKDTDLKIHRSMVMIDHLKNNNGKIDFKKLTAELKQK